MNQIILDKTNQLSVSHTTSFFNTIKIGSAASCVPQSAYHAAIDPQMHPKLGDLALVRVVKLGRHQNIEQESGRIVPIFVGSEFVAVFSNRYAPDYYEGIIPDTLPASKMIDLINAGGTLGTVVSRNSMVGEPTIVEVISFFEDAQGNILNSLDYPRATPQPLTRKKLPGTQLIVVTGASMNAGKSHTAKSIVYGLSQSGKHVVAGKITGTAGKKDILLMEAAGARFVLDFCNFGYPATYKISEEQLFDLFWSMYYHLHTQSPEGGYIVLEIADGIFQDEAYALLSNLEITSVIDKLVFSACDGLSVLAGVQQVKQHFGLDVHAISGPVSNSPLAIREVRRIIPDAIVFNNMALDPMIIKQIFAS